MSYDDKLNTYDFFGYFVPGLVLMLSFYFLESPDWIIKIKSNIAELGTIGIGVVFLVITYLLGHLIQIVGSTFEDKVIDRYCTKAYKISNKKNAPKTNTICRLLICILSKPFHIVSIIIILPFALLYELVCTTFNCCNHDELKHSDEHCNVRVFKKYYRCAIETKRKNYVERYSAHKSMYRGLFIAFYFVSFITFIASSALIGIGSIVLLILSLNRYFHFRKKLINEVYGTTRASQMFFL
ncbi:MAG: hypothetical protein GF403_08840 [Candidatus Coatesbacteria bacterium]|nr:hypothetical protein [Candidatus Coatesbacteria bacterium]